MTELGSMKPAPCTSDMAYPCNTTSINVVSLSLACSGLALLMAIFLTKKVNKYMEHSHTFNALSQRCVHRCILMSTFVIVNYIEMNILTPQIFTHPLSFTYTRDVISPSCSFEATSVEHLK